jgi:bacteriorhodopsin
MSEFLTDGQYTTVYNLLSFGLAAMLFTSIFMILARDRVLPRYRLALITSTMVTGIAAYHYFRIINSFTEAFGEGGDPALYNVGYRYVDWLLTVPLLLVETVAVLALPAVARKGLLLKLVPASFLMIALGYPGDAQLDFLFPAPVWGALSTIPFLFILYVLFVELGRSLERQSPVVRKKVSNLRLLLIATWGVYPIAFLFNMNADGFEAVPFVAREVGYTIADVTAKCLFGLLIYGIARTKSFEDDAAFAEQEGGHDGPARGSLTPDDPARKVPTA